MRWTTSLNYERPNTYLTYPKPTTYFLTCVKVA